jgi:hypothetical protein
VGQLAIPCDRSILPSPCSSVFTSLGWH